MEDPTLSMLGSDEAAHQENVREQDLLFEEDVLRNPYHLKSWLRYLEAKKNDDASFRNTLHERAVKELPGSYKLWYRYLIDRKSQVDDNCPLDQCWEELNNTFERALVFLHKMPKIWKEYLNFRTRQVWDITTTRKTFDRALRALPITQHEQIWPLYRKFILDSGVKETAQRVWRRYLMLQPEQTEDYVKWLVEAGLLDEAATRLADLVNNEDFESIQGKSKHELWFELCDLIAKNPDKVKGMRVEAIIRQGLRRFTSEVGRLWCALADYFIRLGHFEKARDVYEEAMSTVVTARDFSMIFDAYAQFEESMITAKMEVEEDSDDDSDEEEGDDVELEMRLARLEHLMDRRPELFSSVKLRQNPNDVQEWRNRIKLFKDDDAKIVQTFTAAVKTVKPKEADGNLAMLWVAFAQFYERNSDLANARVIMDMATQVDFKKVEDLATVWSMWVEMELQHHNHNQALELCRKATVETKRKRKRGVAEEAATVHQKLHRSTRLWMLYADMEESFGSFSSCKAVYERILELKVATPQLVLNYAAFLEEHKYFEESFKAFERGVHLFNFPYVHDIWIMYLSKFVERYGGSKLERARDMFEQVLSKVGNEQARVFYLMFARLEEDYGLARHAMHIYDRACKALPMEERFEVYLIYISRAQDFFGVMHTREIYAQAVESLPDQQAAIMCLKFNKVELMLGEVDRAREVMMHGAQFCDPRASSGAEGDYWEQWHAFEVSHGNEDTFREMLRVKRSVHLQFTEISFHASDVADAGAAADELAAANEMEKLEQEAPEEPEIEEPKQPEVLQNPEEIDIDMDDDGEEEDEIERKEIPAAVFGDATAVAESGMGALERLKAKK